MLTGSGFNHTYMRTTKKLFLYIIMCMSATGVAAQIKISGEQLQAMRKLQMAENAISTLYVDSVDDKKLAEEAIRGMLKSLDPHSSYSTADETRQLNEPLQGSFEGIGIRYNMVQDTLLIITTITDGPSERVGLLPGDRIVAVDDTVIAGVKASTRELQRRLRGKKGTKVTVDVLRRGIKDLLKFNITRDKIPLNTIDAAYMADHTTGYIQIGSFGATTYKEFMDCVEALKRQGMTRLVLDLQNNGGGYLKAAVRIANEFLADGELITYTEGRNSPRHDYQADGGGRLIDMPVAVLLNEYTASASEIVSGALQDHDRAVIVGRRSFGKGLVQRPIEFGDGSMMRLTTAHYYSPSGRCIQKPYEKGESEDYAGDIEKRFKHGELYHADSIHFADSLRFATLRLHRTVYGGGGIMPDVFVPLDSTLYTHFHRQLVAKGVILRTALAYVELHRDELKSAYPTFEAFDSLFTVPHEMTDALLKTAEEEQVKAASDEEQARSMPEICCQLKANVARSLWTVQEYIRVMNPTLPVFQRGIDALDHYSELLAMPATAE